MILQGNQRAGARALGLHLLKDENDRVDVHEIKGFISDDVVSALEEVYAISRGTKAKQYLYSLSLNPPANENVSTKDFENAIERVEAKLNLTGQPRVIVFHEKPDVNGEQRRHCHAVWSRIDTENMKAIPLPHTKYKLQEISRDLYVEHGWEMPDGFINKDKRNIQNFTLAEWQQAKRNGKDPRVIKTALQDSWAASDDQVSLREALKERGYVLARGDRRGFVALNEKCEPFALPKWIGIKTKEVRARIEDPEKLPSVDEARRQIAKDMQRRLQQLKEEQAQAIANRQAAIKFKQQLLEKGHREKSQKLKGEQEKQQRKEEKARQGMFNRGIKGLLDRLTGKRKRQEKANEIEALKAFKHNQQKRDEMILQQRKEREVVKSRSERLDAFRQSKQQSLANDIQQFRDVADNKQSVYDFRKSMLDKSNDKDREL